MKSNRKASGGRSSAPCSPSSDYVPFGPEWEKEVMQHRKADLVRMFSKACRDRDGWKASHDNQVELKRIIAARPDLAERAPMVEKLMHERNQAQTLNIAFHMQIRKLESISRMDATFTGNPAKEPPSRGSERRPCSGSSGVEAAVCEDIAKRQRLGMNKYGVSVADNPLELREWLNHAYEECLDQAVYLKRAWVELDRQNAERTRGANNQ